MKLHLGAVFQTGISLSQDKALVKLEYLSRFNSKTIALIYFKACQHCTVYKI